jgi:polysaccharide chain length determinant protein (PEP-CTERM system associated)
MINPAKSYTIPEYVEILRRRIWFIVIPFILIAVVGFAYALTAKKIYKASTLVLVSPQRVPEAFVQATVTSKVEERLQSIAQEVMSRTRLEQIITEYKLYENESRHRSKEELVEMMRRNIKVELPTKRDEKGFFTIGFIGDNPQTVTTIANRLASLFIEENLRLREQQAVGTTEFLQSELVLSKAKLDEIEKAVANYKRRHMGELPEQRDTNIKILEQLQNQNQKLSENLRAAQDRKLFIQKQMTDMEMPSAATPVAGLSNVQRDLASGPSAGLEMGATYDSQKERLTRELESLKTRYTANHPDVIAAQKRLADLEKNKGSYDSRDFRKDPRYRELNNQLTLTDMEINRLRDESAGVSDQISRYFARIERAPAREQDMAALLREYQSTKDSYERLLNKSQEAQQAENLERRQKGEQFRVIDPARTPEKPFSPDIPKIMLISLLAGLGAGLAAAFLREQMDRSFHDAADVEITLGLKVLATIPKIDEKVT